MSMRLSRSIVGEAEARAVSRVITEDGYLNMGNEVRLFEEEVARYLGVKPSQVISVNTGTAALHLAVDAVAAQCRVLFNKGECQVGPGTGDGQRDEAARQPAARDHDVQFAPAHHGGT